ncbi:MAG: hypothetical protein GU343_02945, partial [Nanoarchaeota archaeon]|nr:hypothetical protein [Nanoarchaeota archaeon]
YSESQITSIIEKLRSHAPTLYPYLLEAVLYSIQTKLYQQMKVSEIKQGLESIIKRSKSQKLSGLLHKTLGALDLIIDKNLSWNNPYFWNFHSFDIYILPNVEYLFKKLRKYGYQYHILLPSKALELFIKYLSKTLTLYRIKRPSKKVIKSLKDYLRKKIEELERYEEENLPKLLDESVKRIIEIYEKLKPIIENYLTYIENIEIHAKKSLNDLENGDKKRRSPHDYYYELLMINREKLQNAADMRNYIEGILKMLYLVEIGKVSINEIMDSLYKNEDPLSNLKETHNLLLSKQRNLFDCEITKKDWCTKR